MTPRTPPEDAPARVQLQVHRTVVVLDVEDRPGLELTNVNGEVTTKVLPANGRTRKPVKLDDLRTAVEQLGG
jgi:hypothetical protein